MSLIFIANLLLFGRLCSKTKLKGAQCSELVKSSVPSIWLVTREQKLGTIGHRVLLEHSLVLKRFVADLILNPLIRAYIVKKAGADLGGGCSGCAPPLPPEMTCGFLIQLVFCKKKTMWFIGVEVEQETSAPPPKNNPGSAPEKARRSSHLQMWNQGQIQDFS